MSETRYIQADVGDIDETGSGYTFFWSGRQYFIGCRHVGDFDIRWTIVEIFKFSTDREDIGPFMSATLPIVCPLGDV